MSDRMAEVRYTTNKERLAMIEIRDTLKNRLRVQLNGTSIAVQIVGNDTEQQEAFNTLSTHGACEDDAELDKGAGYAFFWTNRAKFARALLSIWENRLVNNPSAIRKFKGLAGGVRPVARRIVARKLKVLPTVCFLTKADVLVKECAEA